MERNLLGFLTFLFSIFLVQLLLLKKASNTTSCYGKKVGMEKAWWWDGQLEGMNWEPQRRQWSFPPDFPARLAAGVFFPALFL